MKSEGERRGGWSAAKVLVVLALLLAANSAYLAAFGDPTVFYVLNTFLHPFLGIVLGILGVIYLARRAREFTGRVGRAAIALLGVSSAY
ncbi:MAG: hypothetical protein ACREUU_19785, partial [Gammaproteobacteria bacterium]